VSGSRFLDRLAENPRTFTWLRKLAEANFTAVRRVIQRELRLPAGSRVLDLGCGTGEMAPLFGEQSYLGLDISRRYITYARRRYPDHRFGVCDAACVVSRPSLRCL
jgi:cyclopropane fatty-acyl-phospholipid synthase-like methyltransferase